MKLRILNLMARAVQFVWHQLLLMTEKVKAKAKKEALQIFSAFQSLLRAGGNDQTNATLGKLMIFETLSRYPARIKCANLSWHTLKAALENQSSATLETRL